MNYLEVKNFSVFLRHKCIVSDVSFSVKRGEVVALLGENGGGKTTLVKGICSLVKSSGEVYIDGKPVTDKNAKEKQKLISYIPQRSEINFHLEVIEIVLMGFSDSLGLFDDYSEEMRIKALQTLGVVGMADRAHDDFLSLSEGQKQLVILTRALVQERKLLIFDEPDSAVDFNNKHLIMKEIRRAAGENKCALLCLHDAGFALKYCDRILIVKSGKIVYNLNVKVADNAELTGALSLIYDGIEVVDVGGSKFMIRNDRYENTD